MKRSLYCLISLLPLSMAACGSNSTGDCTPGAGGNTAKFVTDSLTVPGQPADYAYDLVGSGRKLNQLGVIMSALATNGLKPQDGVTMAIQSGQVVLLLSEKSADTSDQADPCAQATVQNGVSVKTPPTANAMYTVDTTQTGGTFAGPIAMGTFDSSPPATTKTPVTVSLQLPLVPGSEPLKLTVIGAHVKFTNVGGKIMSGQINGAIKATDIKSTVIPKVADLLESKLAADKANPSSTDMSILSLFDTGGSAGTQQSGCPMACSGVCQNPMNADTRACACAVSGDGIVDLCEVATNSIIQSVLAPDVQMFDSSGNYNPNPNPTPTSKDSLSLGLAFTAIPAMF
jgi:hypothetical protein